MTSPIPRGVLCLDTPDDPRIDTAVVYQPSADLLERAHAGWQRFTGSGEDEPDA
ncbi:hypothetical protein [Streptomyces sp. A1136]|uniref:hypothetical protein n=1 Tax=Streptomyces sp. A1136 TaxID=2563102 RepID=UPI0014466871|nr:hypothetical protein [Streptomyces sp. A1136]